MICVERYRQSRKDEWNLFLNGARNATFLFHRSYMEYHSDRFRDYSLMIYKDDVLCSLLPANMREDGILVSHEGLTYGGFVCDEHIKLIDFLEIVYATLEYLNANGVERFRYKAIPAFYNKASSEEIDYAMFLLNASLYRRDLAVTVDINGHRKFSKGRKSEISKARRSGVTVDLASDFYAFWNDILTPNLVNRYDTKPVHSVEEMTLLAERFPQNIKLYCAYLNCKVVAGVVVYETETVAHAQYIGVNDEGRACGALDYLTAHLIHGVYSNKQYFDLGICNEKEGLYINAGLLSWKEGFRGTYFRHDFYEITTSKTENFAFLHHEV